jgi:hypothetical protein
MHFPQSDSRRRRRFTEKLHRNCDGGSHRNNAAKCCIGRYSDSAFSMASKHSIVTQTDHQKRALLSKTYGEFNGADIAVRAVKGESLLSSANYSAAWRGGARIVSSPSTAVAEIVVRTM